MPPLVKNTELRTRPASGCRTIRHILMLAVLACVETVVYPATTRGAEQAVGVLPVLRTTRAAHNLTIEEAAKGYPIRLQAVVTYYDPAPDPANTVLFISDATGSIYVSLAAMPVTALRPGQLVEVTGVSGPGDFAPVISHAAAHVLAPFHLPKAATAVNMADLLTGEYDSQWVEVEGVVHAAHTIDGRLYLDLAMRGGNITAIARRDLGAGGFAEADSLVDASVRLRGNAGTMFNNQRQMTGAHILFPGLETVTVEDAAPVHPYDEPVERIGDLLHYASASGLQHRVHVQGTVTLQWPGHLVCIEDGNHGLCAQIEQKDPLRVGDKIDLLGFATIGAFTPTLVDATYQPALGGQAASPAVIDADSVLSSANDARLVTMEGRLIGHDRSATDPTIVLSSGKNVFSAIFPAVYAAQSLKLGDGSLLRVTGICSMQSDGSKWDSTSGFPIATSFKILVNGPSDVAVLQRPSWWNAAHTLRVLACALVLTLLALLRVMILGRRIRLQNLTIQDSEEKFRHLASHDGLTQLPNRASILSSLQQALDQAQEKKTSVCVALIDLDHFKSINDTLGHMAGDEVLRQSAQRLASAIRSTDIVGRYGGEEFLIVFNDMEQDHGTARCEIVRQALCSEPIRWNEQELTITCSIGVAAARTAEFPVPALVSHADNAMYAAKAQGRNRVVSADSLLAEVTVPAIRLVRHGS